MTLTVEQGQFMPIRITCGENLIYIEQGDENRMLVLEREFAPAFAQAIEAGTGETPKAARSEGRKRGPKGAPKGSPA